MSREAKGMLAAILANTFFGLGYLFSTAAMRVTEPLVMLSVRFMIAFLTLNALLLTGTGKLRLRGKPVYVPMLAGLLEPVLFYALESYGLKFTSTSFTGMMISIAPVIAIALGALFLHEYPTGRQWIYIAISVAGVLLVSMGQGEGNSTLVGVLCLVGAYTMGAVYTLLMRKCTGTFSVFEISYLLFSVASAAFTAWTFVQYGSEAIPMYAEALSDGTFIASVLFLGICGSVAPYMLSNYALGALSVARVSVFCGVTTIVSVVTGVFVMHDVFTWVHCIAFVLILIGVWGTNRFSTESEVTNS